jgi:hypothetical protein
MAKVRMDSNEIPNHSLEEDRVLRDVSVLESATWAPWLAYTPDQLAGQRQIFRPGQFEIYDDSQNLQAILSTNRINWSGEGVELPSWNSVAGQYLTYEDTYDPGGNTLALMSISVNPISRGRNLYRDLVWRAQDYARVHQVEHLIGDFRPSGFGAFKRNTGNFNFGEYCQRTRMNGRPAEPGLRFPKLKRDNQPMDPWLRAIKRLGMKELATDPRAMVVPAPASEMDAYMRSYKPEDWWKVTDPEQISYLLGWHQPHHDLEQVEEVWECGETGTWYVDRGNDQAVYIESNIWGELPIRNERYDLTLEEVLENQLKLIQKVWTDTKGQKDIYNVWLNSHNPLSNIVRSGEASYFPEIADLVDDEVERHSAFLAIVDTRDEQRIVHAARITGPNMAIGGAGDHPDRTFFAGIDELIADGLLSASEFREYYRQKGIDIYNCIGVETNFRVGDKLDQDSIVPPAYMAYLSFFRVLESLQPDLEKVGVFAKVNRASLLSFSRVGFAFEPLLGRDDFKIHNPNNEKDYYMPVFLPSGLNSAWYRDQSQHLPADLYLH